MQALDGRGGVGGAAQEDDRGVGVELAHFGEQAQAVELGHSHVGDDQRDLARAGEEVERLAPGGRFEAGKALLAEHAHQRAPDAGLVVNDEAPGRPVRVRFGNRKCHLSSQADGAHEQRQPRAKPLRMLHVR